MKYSKKNKNLYALICFLVSKCVNEIKEFRYRYENEKVVLYDKVISSVTELKEDNNIGFVGVVFSDDYKTFLSDFKKSKEEMLACTNLIVSTNEGQIWCSCVPWYKFSSVELPYDENCTIPQFTWGQYELRKRRYFINMQIFANHAFVDGFHIGQFIKLFNEIQNNLDKYL